MFREFGREVRHICRHPMLVLTFVAIAFIPTLYSSFLILGSWDPYGHLESLPVAVVNLDRGAVYEGKPMTVGADFVKELQDNRSFDWRFVDEAEAADGMKGNRYYAAITIPPDFSAQAASVAGDHPRQAQIVYESNSYYNFIAGQISENAIKELRSRLSESLTEAYTRSLFAQIGTISSGFAEAADAAGKLGAGAGELRDGIGRLGASVPQLAAGAAQLRSGAEQSAAAGARLQQGAEQAASGADGLSAGIGKLKAGADRLSDGLAQSAAGAGALEAGLKDAASAAGQLAGGSEQVADGLEKLMQGNAALADNAELKRLLAASREVAQGAKALQAGQQQLHAGASKLAQGEQTLATGSRELSQGHLETLQGVQSLQAGQRQVADGLKQFNGQFAQLVSGSRKLASGIGQLQAGTGPLSAGAAQLADGAGQLQRKLGDAADETAAIHADDDVVRMLAEPVSIAANDDRKLKLYASGIAPYFISIALFAGALVFTTIFSARGAMREGQSRFGLFVRGLLIFGLMSAAQSLLLCLILVYAVGLDVQSVPRFIAFTMLTGLAFMFINQACVTWLDQVGRFIVLVLMILQLSSSAGTFPLELLPGWAKALNPWLPMTYAIRGFRDVIASGNFADLREQAAYLAPLLFVFPLATLAFFLTRRRVKPSPQP